MHCWPKPIFFGVPVPASVIGTITVVLLAVTCAWASPAPVEEVHCAPIDSSPEPSSPATSVANPVLSAFWP